MDAGPSKKRTRSNAVEGDPAAKNYFQAFKDHKIVSVFHRPGECDLTTNVDFAFLKEAVKDLGTWCHRLTAWWSLSDAVIHICLRAL